MGWLWERSLWTGDGVNYSCGGWQCDHALEMSLCDAQWKVWLCDINSRHYRTCRTRLSQEDTCPPRCKVLKCLQTHTSDPLQSRTSGGVSPLSITLISSPQTADSPHERQVVVREVSSKESSSSSSMCLCVLVLSVQKKGGVSANNGVHTPSCHFITACRQTHYIQHLLPSQTLRVCSCVCVCDAKFACKSCAAICPDLPSLIYAADFWTVFLCCSEWTRTLLPFFVHEGVTSEE